MSGAELAALVERLTSDLDPDAAVAWGAQGSDVAASLLLDGVLAVAAFVSADQDPAAAALHVVGAFQDAVVERRGRAAPPCPGHPHPAVLRATGSTVRWACPRTDEPVY